MFIKFGNIFYFLPMIILVGFTIGLIFFTRNKSKSFNDKLIFIILLVNTILHFLKIFLPTKDYLYDLPYSFAKISFDNICAVSVIFFPILYLTRNKYCRDIMVILGPVSALAAYIMPTALFVRDLGNPTDFIEVFRYYMCHLPLFACPILMLTNKLHKLSYRRVYADGLLFMANLTIVFLNAILLKLTNIVVCTWDQIFSRNFFNPSLVFGPPYVSSQTTFKFFDYIVPSFFNYVTSTGDKGYIPVLWFTFPLLILTTVITLGLMAVQHKQVKKDYLLIKAKIRIRRLERNAKKEN